MASGDPYQKNTLIGCVANLVVQGEEG